LFALLVVLALVAPGCEDLGEAVGGNPGEAMAVADAFLAAIEAGDVEAAWSLVHERVRASRFANDVDQFRRHVADIDLAQFDWEVTGAEVHDGHYHVTVRLDPLEVDEALGAFMQVVEVDGVPTAARIQVDIEPFGVARGVVGG
jgi:hypothetical protein